MNRIIEIMHIKNFQSITKFFQTALNKYYLKYKNCTPKTAKKNMKGFIQRRF